MPIGKVAEAEGAVADAEFAVRSRQREPFALHAAGEVLDVPVGLEADQVVGGERLEQPAMDRHGEPHVGRRPGNVQEESDAVLDAEAAKLGGERNQVIVLNPDDVVGLQLRGEHAGEERIDAEIAGDVLVLEVGEIEPVVKQRPEGAIGEAGVVFVDIALGQVDEGKLDVALLAPVDVELLGVGPLRGVAGPAQPQPATLGEHGLQRHRQTARLGALIARRRNPVRNHHQPAHRTSFIFGRIGLAPSDAHTAIGTPVGAR